MPPKPNKSTKPTYTKSKTSNKQKLITNDQQKPVEKIIPILKRKATTAYNKFIKEHSDVITVYRGVPIYRTSLFHRLRL